MVGSNDKLLGWNEGMVGWLVQKMAKYLVERMTRLSGGRKAGHWAWQTV
jgi:hypothetical protein